MKIEEQTDKEVPELELITQNIAALTAIVQTQNDIILCLLHKFNITHDLPFWLTKEGMEEEIEPKVKACTESVRRLYGHSKTDKS